MQRERHPFLIPNSKSLAFSVHELIPVVSSLPSILRIGRWPTRPSGLCLEPEKHTPTNQAGRAEEAPFSSSRTDLLPHLTSDGWEPVS
jgi:hypothetical protein